MKSKIITFVLALMLVPTLASALTIDIQVPSSFGVGEQVYFDYSIESATDQDITFTPHVMCPNAPIAFLQDVTQSLQAGVPFSDTYTDITITDDIEPQTCTAYIQITSHVQQREEKTFTITTLPGFDFAIDLDKTVFLKNEQINLDYTSELDGLQVTATLTSPSGSSQNVQIPSVLQLDEIGTYVLNAQASKADYKTMQVSKQIGIIESSANIQTGAPQSSGTINVPLEIPDYLLYVLVIVVLVVLVLVYMKMRSHPNVTVASKSTY